MMPQALRRPGAKYFLGPLPWGHCQLFIECSVRDHQRYTMRIGCIAQIEQESTEQQWNWEGTWGDEKLIQLL